MEDFQSYVDFSTWYKLIEEKSWMKNDMPCEDITRVLKRKFGGMQSDYGFIYEFFNSFTNDDPRSKYVLNHSWGIFDAESIFGVTFIRESDKKLLPTRTVAESYISTNFSFIPTPSDWISSIEEQTWMYFKALQLSKDEELEKYV
jgi:hypothetical protein